MSGALPPLSLSILGVEPLDEFTLEIADFIHHTIMTRKSNAELGVRESKIEVEVKIGVIRETGTGMRLRMPVLVETILDSSIMDVRFESNMSMRQHQHLNQLLNKLHVTSQEPGHTASPIGYAHHFLTDSFYGAGDARVRVTRNDKTKEVTALRKIKLANLEIYSPKKQADWRVTVSLECPVEHPTGTAGHSRRKDRLSYQHEEFSIDLTQVQVSDGTGPLHELELEILRPDLVLSLAHKRNDPNVSEVERSGFDELIRAFVNNARILVRNVCESG
ncbi:CYTH-like domain-containing protein [Schizophyllum fasciatum]